MSNGARSVAEKTLLSSHRPSAWTAGETVKGKSATVRDFPTTSLETTGSENITLKATLFLTFPVGVKETTPFFGVAAIAGLSEKRKDRAVIHRNRTIHFFIRIPVSLQ
jgi:hypothetical protein